MRNNRLRSPAGASGPSGPSRHGATGPSGLGLAGLRQSQLPPHLQPGPAPPGPQSRIFHLDDKLKKYAGYKEHKVKIVGAKGNSKWDVIYPYGVEGECPGSKKRVTVLPITSHTTRAAEITYNVILDQDQGQAVYFDLRLDYGQIIFVIFLPIEKIKI